VRVLSVSESRVWRR